MHAFSKSCDYRVVTQWATWSTARCPAASNFTDGPVLLSQLNYNDPYWPEVVLGSLRSSDKGLALHCELVALHRLWNLNTKKHIQEKEWQRRSFNLHLCMNSLSIYTKILSEELFLMSFFFSFQSLPTSQNLPPPSHLHVFPIPSLDALAPSALPLPLGVLAELCLWFTHSVPSS